MQGFDAEYALMDDTCALEEVFTSMCDNDETGDLWVFLDLLTDMFHLDPKERITPDQVLNHPFITMSHL